MKSINTQQLKDYVYYEDNSDWSLQKSRQGLVGVSLVTLFSIVPCLIGKLFAAAAIIAAVTLAAIVILAVWLKQNYRDRFSDRLFSRGMLLLYMSAGILAMVLAFAAVLNKPVPIYILCLLCVEAIFIMLFWIITESRIRRGKYCKKRKISPVWGLLGVPSAVAGIFLGKAIVPHIDQKYMFYLGFGLLSAVALISSLYGLKHLVRYYLYKKYFAGVE